MRNPDASVHRAADDPLLAEGLPIRPWPQGPNFLFPSPGGRAQPRPCLLQLLLTLQCLFSPFV